MEKRNKKLWLSAGGFAVGLVNGLLGAGGGLLAVPLLRSTGLDTRAAHANSVATILPICTFSAGNYLLAGRVTFGDITPYLLWGLMGAVLGAILLPKIPQKLLRKLFAGFMLWAGLRLLMK